jgi:hypothetical protein
MSLVTGSSRFLFPILLLKASPSPTRTFCVNNRKIDMSTITEIQEAIEKLPTSEKSALAAWLLSKQEPIMSEAEEAALLARLDKAAAELDSGKGIPLDRVREKIRGWAGKVGQVSV